MNDPLEVGDSWDKEGRRTIKQRLVRVDLRGGGPLQELDFQTLGDISLNVTLKKKGNTGLRKKRRAGGAESSCVVGLRRPRQPERNKTFKSEVGKTLFGLTGLKEGNRGETRSQKGRGAPD